MGDHDQGTDSLVFLVRLSAWNIPELGLAATSSKCEFHVALTTNMHSADKVNARKCGTENVAFLFLAHAGRPVLH